MPVHPRHYCILTLRFHGAPEGPVARVGRVPDLHFTVSHRQPKLITIEKHPKDEVMQLERAGKADRLAGQTLDPGPQGSMVALDLRWMPLARGVLVGLERPRAGTPILGVGAGDPTGLQQRFSLPEHVVCASAKDRGPHPTAPVSDGMPAPALRCFLANNRPHVVHCGVLHALENDLDISGGQSIHQELIDTDQHRGFLFNSRMTVVGLLCNTRAVGGGLNAPALETHVNDLLFGGGSTPCVRALKLQGLPRAVRICARVPLFTSLGLTTLHDVGTLTGGTEHGQEYHATLLLQQTSAWHMSW